MHVKISGELHMMNWIVLLQVNDAPYEDGWLIKIKMSDPGELSSLLDSDAYSKQISS
jgi:glycine cleavage system H lipoate-binding protein